MNNNLIKKIDLELKNIPYKPNKYYYVVQIEFKIEDEFYKKDFLEKEYITYVEELDSFIFKGKVYCTKTTKGAIAELEDIMNGVIDNNYLLEDDSLEYYILLAIDTLNSYWS